MGPRRSDDGISFWARQAWTAWLPLRALRTAESRVVISPTWLSFLSLDSCLSTLTLQRCVVKCRGRSWDSWMSTLSFFAFNDWVIPGGVIVTIEAIQRNGRSRWSGWPRWSWWARNSRVVKACTSPWLSFLTLVSIHTRTTRSPRHSNLSFQSWRPIRTSGSNRSWKSSLSLHARQSIQLQEVAVRSDH